MLDLNQERIAAVIQEAFNSAQAAGSRRWEMAIVRAKQIIEENPYLHLNADGSLLMLSDSGQIYTVTAGRCDCAAHRKGQPCKHRAARKILLRYYERGH